MASVPGALEASPGLGAPALGHVAASIGASATVTTRVARLASSGVRGALYLAVISVPLAFASPDAMFGYADVPKIAALRFAAALAAFFWVIEWAAASFAPARAGLSAPAPAAVIKKLWSAPRHSRQSRWLILAVAAFGAVYLVSTALSVSFQVSVTGAYPGYDGYDLYTTASFLVLAAAAATHLRRRMHIETVLWSLAVSGALSSVYGLVQFAGFDPFEFDRFEVNRGRAPLTFGNPSFAGSFLVLSFLAAAGLALSARRLMSRPGLLAWAVLAIQLVALGATASRGAWTGVAVGILVLVLLAHRAGFARPWARLAIMLAPVVLAVALIIGLSGSDQATRAVDRLQSLSGGAFTTGLNGRQATWDATFSMLSSRIWLDGESGGVLRHLFGYGPDTYRYAYALVAPDEHVTRLVPHPHNTLMHAAAELGWAGFTAWTLLLGVALWTGLRLALNRKNPPWMLLTAATLTAMLAGWLVDQQVNISRSSDATAFWALTGSLIALALVADRRRALENDDNNTADNDAAPAAPAPSAGPRFSPVPVLAIALVPVIMAVTWFGNGPHLIADARAGALSTTMAAGSTVEELAAMAGSASSVAPDVAFYHAVEAAALETAAAAIALDSLPKQQLEARALEARREADRVNELGQAETFQLARALYQAASANRPALISETVAAYEDTVRKLPHFWNAWLELAASYALAGRTEDGVAALKTAAELVRSQAVTTRDNPTARQNFATTHELLGLEPGLFFP